MSRQISPRLFGIDIVVNSFGSCISNTPKESSSAPKMSSSEIISQPRMFVQKFKGSVSFKQLKCFTNTNCWWQLNKQMDVINSNLESVNLTSMLNCNFMDESLIIHLDLIKLKGIQGMFRFPDKMESILPEFMAKTFQIHFFAPKVKVSNKAHANFVNLFREPKDKARYINELQELNFMEKGSPPKLKSKGIRAFML